MGVVYFESAQLRNMVVESFPEDYRSSLDGKSFPWCVEALVAYNRQLKAKLEATQTVLANMTYDAKMVAAAKALLDAQRTFARICGGSSAQNS